MKIILKLRQNGVIFIALMLVLFVLGSTVVLGSLNNRHKTSLAQQAELLRQMEIAKTNLLAYLVNSHIYFDGTASEQGPGFLPCPDTDDPTALPLSDPDGLPNSPCNPTNTAGQILCGATNTSRPLPKIGRLPQYIDANGYRTVINDYYAGNPHMRFWYVVAPRYLYHTTSTSVRRSLLRTSTSLTAANPPPACMRLYLDNVPEYIALIIAPGEELETQTRAANATLYSNYLDGQNGGDKYNYYTKYESNPKLFNDQVIGITLDEYVKAVGRRIAIESQKEMDTYYTTHTPGYYPASQTTFRGLLDDVGDQIWLQPSSVSTEGERWSTDTTYSISAGIATISFSGCTGITFRLTYPDGVVQSGTGSC